MRIYLVRHGQTTGDIEDRYGGNYDDHLTELGVTQAMKLAEKLKNTGIEKIYASPLMRAQETARVLSSNLNIETETIEALRERNWYGILTGMIKSEAKKQYPEEVEKLNDYRTTPTDGEEYTDFGARFVQAWNKIIETNIATVAVVTHGSGPIKYVFREMLGHTDIKVEDCGFAILEIENGQIKLIETNGIEIKQ